MTVAPATRFTRVEVDEGLSTGGVNFVGNVDDLSKTVNGVITLEANQSYYLNGNLDLKGARLVGSANSCILGATSENSTITSTGLDGGTALISSAWSLPMRNITLTHGTALDLDANGNANQALDWYGVNFLDCATVGTIANYSNFSFQTGALLNSGGMTFDGEFGTIGFSQSLFDTPSGGTGIIIPATATITRRFRIIYSAFVNLSGETGINVSSSATVPIEGYILDTVNFGGGGTYTTGVAYDDNKALWVNNRGVRNSAEIGHMTLNSNATATTVSATSTPYKAAGTTSVQPITQKFTHASNRLTYSGAITRDFEVTVVASLASSNNNQIGCYVAKNGAVIDNSEICATANASGRAENVAIQTVIDLEQGDYVEFWVESITAANDITVSDMAFIVKGLN